MLGWRNVDHRRWRKIVVDAYGSLDAFPDSHSVRIMLGLLRREVIEHDRITATIHHQLAKDDWDLTFAADLATCKEYITELETWLKTKGMSE